MKFLSDFPIGFCNGGLAVASIESHFLNKLKIKELVKKSSAAILQVDKVVMHLYHFGQLSDPETIKVQLARIRLLERLYPSLLKTYTLIENTYHQLPNFPTIPRG